MRIFKLEMKRLFKSKRTQIIILASIVISVCMAFMSIYLEDGAYINEKGKRIDVNGIQAINHFKSSQSTINGEVTLNKLKDALEVYQSTVKQYGQIDNQEIPFAVYDKNITPISPLIKKLQEIYGDPVSGRKADLMEVNVDEIEKYYAKSQQYLNEKMAYASDGAKAHVKRMYQEVKKPFCWYSGYTYPFTFDHMELCIFILVLILVTMIAPAFSDDYQTGADAIFRCTKFGRQRLGIIRTISSLLLTGGIFIICLVIYVLIENMVHGTEGLQTSIQMLYSSVCLPNLTLGQLQFTIGIMGLLSLVSSIGFTLFVSARCKDTMTTLIISLGGCMMPLFLYACMGENIISVLLPSAGIGVNNDFLYQITHFNYLRIGYASIWTPYIIVCSTVVWIPVLIALAIIAYKKRKI